MKWAKTPFFLFDAGAVAVAPEADDVLTGVDLTEDALDDGDFLEEVEPFPPAGEVDKVEECTVVVRKTVLK
jgi:glutathione synthase/RimK-type ligase-like ATP-grasp enzyme